MLSWVAIFTFITSFVPKAKADSLGFTVTGMGAYDTIASGQWVVNNAVYNNAMMAGIIDLLPTTLNGVTLPPNQNQLISFCIEISQDIYLGNSYTFPISPLIGADEGSITAAQARYVQILYDLYYQGDNPANWTNTTASAFQLAIWEITSDTGMDLSTGNFRNNGASNPEIAIAQNILNQVAITGSNSSYNPYTVVDALTDPAYQDLSPSGTIIQSIPFGINAWPGAVLLVLLASCRLHRRLQTAA